MTYPISRLRRAPAKLDELVRHRLFQWHYEERAELLSGYERERKLIQSEFEGLYATYTTEISTAQMAISLEAACLLAYMCRSLSPSTILDLGSGFSSVVFRTYAKSASKPVRVVSVDDDSEWLEKTSGFLSRFGLSRKELWNWQDLVHRPRFAADLILHDLGRSDFRCATMPLMPEFSSATTFLMVDDTHKSKVRDAAARMVEQSDLRYSNLEKISTDSFGRSQWLISGFKSRHS